MNIELAIIYASRLGNDNNFRADLELTIVNKNLLYRDNLLSSKDSLS